MFKKLVGNIPYNPSLIGQLGFYSKRLRQEESVRRAGFVVMALAMLVQTFSIIVPPQSTLASGPNDIVWGGQSKEDILRAYDSNRDAGGRQDIQAIYNYYGITRQNIVDSQSTTIHHSQGTDLFSTGRQHNSRNPSVDVKTPISGAVNGYIYQRPLSIWGNQNFKALKGVNSRGQTFWLLIKGCGNVVMESTQPEPDLEINKKLSRNLGDSVKVGDNVYYKLLFRNSGQGTAEATWIGDTLPKGLDYVSHETSHDMHFQNDNPRLAWSLKTGNNNLAPSSNWYEIDIKTVVTSDAVGEQCNSATINASNSPTVSAGNPKSDLCVTIAEPPVCPDTGLPIPPGGVTSCTTTCASDGSEIPYDQSCPTPVVSCQSLQIAARPSWDKVNVKTTFLAQPGATVSRVTYFDNDQEVAVADLTEASMMHTQELMITPGDHKIRAQIEAGSGSEVRASTTCEIMLTAVEPQELTPLITHKKEVSNVTQGIDDANNTTANAGDTLEFSLVLANEGDGPALNQPMIDEVIDILEYADIVDDGGAEYDQVARTLSWPVTNIEPGQTVTRKFSVQVKNPIPTTPISASDPLSYDMMIHNFYGNSVNVKLPTTISKEIEVIAVTLPNTGPSMTMLLSAFVFTMAAYFLFRTHLLAKESDLIIAQQTSGGI